MSDEMARRDFILHLHCLSRIVCGICGKLYFHSQKQIEKHLLVSMTDELGHRGPDEHGYYLDHNIGMGHRRLSIIDLSTGQQPMGNARQDLWIVFNGEIYNFLELRQDLEQHGYTCETNSDTEVILHLYDLYGLDCVKQLRGMFAFAIWDKRHQRLFLARDRFGQKPLFYHCSSDAISFASEIKALLQDPSIPRELNHIGLHHYLTYQYIPPPDTMFHQIHKLPPAHILVCEQGAVSIRRYWNLYYEPKVVLSEAEILEQLEERLLESVKIRMISDVPIGAFLSGGIDSSLVVAMMSQYSSHPVKTFSIGFKEKSHNELPYAKIVAERFNTEHYEFIVEPDAVDILPRLIWHFDEPFGDASAIPTYYVSQMTSQYVKVALNGDGGDEAFAGYLRYLGYKIVRYYRQLPTSLRRRVIGPALRMFSRSVPWERTAPFFRRARLLNDLSLEAEEHLYTQNLTIFQNPLKSCLYTEALQKELDPINSLEYTFQYFHSSHAKHFTDKMLYADIMTYLPGDLLVKIDRMMMAHGLEGRSPFLDHKLMEFVATLPPNLKIRRGRLKVLLKELGKSWLPQQILTRRKQGFGVPIGQWFRHELRDMIHDTLLSSQLVQDGYLNGNTIQQILQEHQHKIQDHRHRIWLLLNLELWYRMFICHA